MNAAQQTEYLIDDRKYFLKALLYFDIFSYPLTADEIVAFAPAKISSSNIHLLDRLVSEKEIFRFGSFYSIQNDPALADRRIKGNRMAEKEMKKARRFSRIISAFPFVRAVMLSGSISKNFMDEKSDIDYFIITERGHLWFVRTALAFFRRVFLFNSHKNFCTNYFLDTDNLFIPDNNVFAAIELVTLKAMYGETMIQNFHKANSWAKGILPQAKIEYKAQIKGKFFLKRIGERILSSKIFRNFDAWLMEKNLDRWKKKYAHFLNASDFEIAFRSTPGISRSHPQFFQKKVLGRFEQKVKDFELRHGIDLGL